MLRLYDLTTCITKFGFCLTFIINALFINLTVSYAKSISKTYKKMLVFFALLCIIFAGIDVTCQPFILNFNGGLVYFSLADDNFFSFGVLWIVLLINSSCYVAQLSCIAVQFLFRYLTLIDHPLRNSFQGFKQLLWILYFLSTGVIYGVLVLVFLKTDDYSDGYMAEEMRKVFGKHIKFTPRILAVAYEHGKVRWTVLTYYSLGSCLMGVQYLIVIFCALKMRSAMKTELRRFSTRNRNLEVQFFKALTIQILLPTFLMTLPIGFVLLAPLLDAKMSVQSGVIFALYSLYPPLDSIATMIIVKEYRGCLRKFWRDFTKSPLPKPNEVTNEPL